MVEHSEEHVELQLVSKRRKSIREKPKRKLSVLGQQHWYQQSFILWIEFIYCSVNILSILELQMIQTILIHWINDCYINRLHMAHHHTMVKVRFSSTVRCCSNAMSLCLVVAAHPTDFKCLWHFTEGLPIRPIRIYQEVTTECQNVATNFTDSNQLTISMAIFQFANCWHNQRVKRKGKEGSCGPLTRWSLKSWSHEI